MQDTRAVGWFIEHHVKLGVVTVSLPPKSSACSVFVLTELVNVWDLALRPLTSKLQILTYKIIWTIIRFFYGHSNISNIQIINKSKQNELRYEC